MLLPLPAAPEAPASLPLRAAQEASLFLPLQAAAGAPASLALWAAPEASGFLPLRAASVLVLSLLAARAVLGLPEVLPEVLL